MFNVIKDNAAGIYRNYRNIPVKTPLRVKQLTEEITKDKATDFDKIKAIEGYLAANYEYLETPGPVPPDKDFVDYFLFENKKGYCTYYSTAMAVMARCIGLPSRYVEGYRVYPYKNIPDDGYYEVINYDSAHAWPEIYLEGIGWTPFEPTSPYYDYFYWYMDKNLKDSFKNSANGTDNDADNFTSPDVFISDGENSAGVPSKPPDSDPEDQEPSTTGDPVPVGDGTDPSESALPGTNGSGTVVLPSFLPFDDDPDAPDPESADFPPGASKVLLCISGLLLLSAGWALMNKYRAKFVISRTKTLTPGKSVINMYICCHKLFRQMGFAMTSRETPYEFCRRAASDPLIRKFNLEKVSELYLKSRYSREPISDEDRSFMIDSYSELLDIQKLKLGKVKYFVFRYLLGMF